jgi:peptidylprolyl isomerase
VRKWPALALASALVISLAACGSDDSKSTGSGESKQSSAAASSPAASTPAAADAKPASKSGDLSGLKNLKVTGGDNKKTAPKASFDTPASTKAKAGAVLANQGKGAALKKGNLVDVRIAQFNAKTGKEMSSGSWASSQQITLDSATFTSMPDLYSVLQTSKVGADVAYFIPSSVTGSEAQVWVLRPVSQEQAPKKASAAEVKKLKAAGKLPTVKFSKSKPTITIPKSTTAPKDLIVDVLKEGTGKVATESSTVTAKYQGVRWADGKVFDGTYDKSPKTADFPLNGVIAGWTKGLTGLKQGTKVMLTIPTSMAYGKDAATQGKPAGTLVFIVELDKVS